MDETRGVLKQQKPIKRNLNACFLKQENQLKSLSGLDPRNSTVQEYEKKMQKLFPVTKFET